MANPQSTFQRVMAEQQTGQPRTIADAYNDYLAGKLSPQEKIDFENDVNSGHIMLPQGASLSGKPKSPLSVEPVVLPQDVTERYLRGELDDQQKADLEHDINAGLVKLPPSIESQIPGMSAPGQAPTEQGVMQPAAPGPSLGDRLSGFMQAAGVTTANAILGTVGMVAGSVEGITKTMMDGSYGTPEGAAQAQQIMQQRMQGGMMQAATPEGERQTAAVGELLGQLTPTIGLPGEMAMAGGVARATAPAATQIGREAAAAGKAAAVTTAEAAAQKVGQVAQAAKETVASAPEKIKGMISKQEEPNQPLVDVAQKAASGDEAAAAELAKQAMPDPEKVAAAQRLGIEDYLQPDHVTTNQAFRELSQAIKSVPTSIARSEELEGLNQVAKRADELIGKYGATDDLSTLDKSVQDQLRATQSKFDAQAEMLYGKVEQLIPKTQTVKANSTLSFLKQEANNMGGLDKLAKASPLEARLMTELSDPNITYSFLDTKRKQIGQALSKATGPFKDSESGLLKKLYASLSQDQENIARANGDEAFYAYKAAQYATRLKKGVEDDLTALFGKEVDKSMVGSLNSAMTALPKGDVSKLTNMLNSVPKNMRQQVVASGLNTAFGKSAKNGDFSPAAFANWYEQLQKNKQAHNLIMANLPPEARTQLNDLYLVADGIAKSSRERIATGRINVIREQLQNTDALIFRLREIAKKAGVAAAAEAITTPMGLPGAGIAATLGSVLTKNKPDALAAADALITSKSFRKAIKPIEEGDTTKAVEQLKASPELYKFLKKSNMPVDLQFRIRWLTDLLKNKQSQPDESKKF